MPEVNTRFEQLLHGDVSQTTSFLVCIPCSVANSGLLSRPRTGAREDWTAIGSGFLSEKPKPKTLAIPLSLAKPRGNVIQPGSPAGSLREANYRLLNWKRFLAPFWPYFLRSLPRASRLTSPSDFNFLRSSTLNCMRARAMPSFTASA